MGVFVSDEPYITKARRAVVAHGEAKELPVSRLTDSNEDIREYEVGELKQVPTQVMRNDPVGA